MKIAMKPGTRYVAAAAVLVVVGAVLGQLLVRADVRYVPAAGVSVFAVLYVLAQGVERVVELVIGAITALDKDFAENRKRTALASMAVVRALTAPAPPLGAGSDAAREAKEARLDLGVLAQGLAFALAYPLVSYFEFGIFQTIGVQNMAPAVDRALTAAAVMGGAKGLHDLMGKVQKSKESSESKAA